MSDQLVDIVKSYIGKQEWENANEILKTYHKNQMKNSSLEVFSVMTEIEINDRQNNVPSFFEGLNSYAEIMEKYMEIRFLLQRIECDMPDDDYRILKKAIEMKNVSLEAVFTLIICSCVDKLKVLNKLKQWSFEWKNKELISKIELLDISIEKAGITTAYSKRTAKEMM